MSDRRIEIMGRESGPVATMTYVVREPASGAWALVDPTYGALEAQQDLIAESGAPEAMWLTHGHFDHLGGLAEARARWPETPVWGTAETAAMCESAQLNGAALFGF